MCELTEEKPAATTTTPTTAVPGLCRIPTPKSGIGKHFFVISFFLLNLPFHFFGFRFLFVFFSSLPLHALPGISNPPPSPPCRTPTTDRVLDTLRTAAHQLNKISLIMPLPQLRHPIPGLLRSNLHPTPHPLSKAAMHVLPRRRLQANPMDLRDRRTLDSNPNIRDNSLHIRGSSRNSRCSRLPLCATNNNLLILDSNRPTRDNSRPILDNSHPTLDSNRPIPDNSHPTLDSNRPILDNSLPMYIPAPMYLALPCAYVFLHWSFRGICLKRLVLTENRIKDLTHPKGLRTPVARAALGPHLDRLDSTARPVVARLNRPPRLPNNRSQLIVSC